MKINILSDLHLGFSAMERPGTEADLVVLAGDIARPREAVDWALGLAKPVLYVPGNHEFYGSSLDGTIAELRRLCAGTPICLLDDDEVIVDGVRFIGSTLWTDFELFGPALRRDEAMAAGARMLRDFSRIRVRDAAADLFTPIDAAARFRRHASWLDERLGEAHAGPTVVITHHAPSPRSIHARFAGSPLNACFVSNAEHLLGAPRAALWIHGHTHDSFDYDCGGTRVVCNPRGYARDGVIENACFDPHFIVEVNVAARQ
jgi:predicted phosphodiesterase